MRYKDAVVSVWAFLESIAWFIAADYPLFLYALKDDDWTRLLGLVAGGSALGIIAHYTLFLLFPSTMEAVLMHTPFVQDWMFPVVNGYLSSSLFYAAVQPWTLIAVKTWTYTVYEQGHAFAPYLILVMAGRVTRWAAVIGSAKALTWWDERFATDWYYYVCGAWTAVFAAIMIIAET